ncbi:hypothetical protein RB595_008374 [Gaeumannomyces hyphopodioides]
MADGAAGADLGAILGPTLPFAAIGLLTALYWVCRVASFGLAFARPSRLSRYLHHGGGPVSESGSGGDDGQQQRPPWALVTGASDGIGKHLAAELADFGFNVVLHGRNPEKLAKVEETLADRFPSREFRVIVADVSRVPCSGCSKPASVAAAAAETGEPSADSKEVGISGGGDEEPADSNQGRAQAASASAPAAVDFDAILAQLADLHLTVVINNAGGALHDPGPFCGIEAYSARSLTENVSANALFPLVLTSRLMPRLTAASPALVVNVGSMSDQAMPRLPSYAPSKAFLNCMSSCLALDAAFEGGPRGAVEVMCVRVGDSTGTAHQGRRPSLFVPDAGRVARSILARVGCGRAVVVPYFWHAVQDAAAGMLPTWLKERIIIHAMRQKAEQERLGLA